MALKIGMVYIGTPPEPTQPKNPRGSRNLSRPAILGHFLRVFGHFADVPGPKPPNIPYYPYSTWPNPSKSTEKVWGGTGEAPYSHWFNVRGAYPIFDILHNTDNYLI